MIILGDQLVLKHHTTLDGSEVSFKGRITKVPDKYSDEFVLEMNNQVQVPTYKLINFVFFPSAYNNPRKFSEKVKTTESRRRIDMNLIFFTKNVPNFQKIF